jgi:hypothetical protein
LCPGEGEGRGWRGAGGRELWEQDDELDSLHIGSNQEIREECRKKRRWRETRRRRRVTTQDFIKFWGKFFAFVLLEMFGISQGFKTFRVYLKALIENYFKLSTIFLKNFLEKDQVSKYYFPSYIQTYASLLAKERITSVFYLVKIVF